MGRFFWTHAAQAIKEDFQLLTISAHPSARFQFVQKEGNIEINCVQGIENIDSNCSQQHQEH